MINDIKNIVDKNIQILKSDDNIVSIFVVGSMAADNYNFKKFNDYDIRFVVKDFNPKIMEKINNSLINIKRELLNLDYECEISDVVGPVKMVSKSDKNILLHAITLTKEDLDNLPNIHKYSYSCNYKQLHGIDLVEDYKKIIITPDDIINSTEGIDYCIDLIKRRKISYNKPILNDDNYFFKSIEENASDNDMIELFNYSYNKTKNNIINMIKTNNISHNINDYLDLSENELLLIKKIEENELNNDDIDVNINNIISILLKLKKVCLQLYKSKKYYNSLEWGIINTESREMRNKGFEFLKEIGLSTGNNFTIKYTELKKEETKIANELIKSNYLVLFEPPSNEFKRFGVNDVNSIDKINDFIKERNYDFNQYSVSFIEKIRQLPNSYAGTLLSDGKGNTIIEIVKDTCDSRELTSIGVDSNRIKQYRFISFNDFQAGLPSEIKDIKDVCQYFKGYYEFAYGNIKNLNDIYFTFYSNNDEYINIFEGGKKYGKTLRNR